jgi:hypothetical protein
MNLRIGQARTSGYTRGGIRCLGGENIPCRLVTPAVSPNSSGTNRSQDQCIKNDWYETHQTSVGLKEGCTGKLDRCNDRNIYGKLL